MNNAIRKGKFRFPDASEMHPNNRFPLSNSLARNDFLSKLLTVSTKNRLGCGPRGAEELLDHPWLKGIDMNKVVRGGYEPSFKPSVICFDID